MLATSAAAGSCPSREQRRHARPCMSDAQSNCETRASGCNAVRCRCTIVAAATICIQSLPRIGRFHHCLAHTHSESCLTTKLAQPATRQQHPNRTRTSRSIEVPRQTLRRLKRPCMSPPHIAAARRAATAAACRMGGSLRRHKRKQPRIIKRHKKKPHVKSDMPQDLIVNAAEFKAKLGVE